MAKFSGLFKRGDKAPPPTSGQNDRPQMWAPAPPAAAVNPPPQPGNSRPRMRFRPSGRQPIDMKSQPQQKAITPEDLYDLRELMRTKYTRDVEVYSMRKAYRANLPRKEEAQRKADQAMQEIVRRVAAWDHDNTWDPEELELVRDIQRRLGLRYASVYDDGLNSNSDLSSKFSHVSVSDAR